MTTANDINEVETTETETTFSGYSATYSPEDNKLRLYSLHRLPAETYNRVKAAGFKWAPKQEVFVAPMWTPSREDLLLELCGEIGDEDTTLLDRAEQRAERFEDYKESRIADAQQAQNVSDQIAERLWGGQPILVGHHSEKRARKDQERIHNNMRKAVTNWKTASYWEQRAAGAIHHAKYKELPAVRYRRIKGLEADQRKRQRAFDHSKDGLEMWTKCQNEQDKDRQKQFALRLSSIYRLTLNRKEGDREGFNADAYTAITGEFPNLYAPRTIEEIFETALRVFPRSMEYEQRWIDHYTNRIAYEKAMLGESGGIVAEKHDIAVGGRVFASGEWLLVLKVNKKDGAVTSVKTNRRYVSTLKVEDIKEYKAPTAEETAAVQKATKLPPLCNYPGEGFATCTQEQWAKIHKDYKSQSHRIAATETTAAHRVRYASGVYLTLPPMPEGKDSTERSNQRHRYYPVYVTDAKRIDPPAPKAEADETRATLQKMAADARAENPLPKPRTAPERDSRIPTHEEMRELKQQAAQGVAVVVVPQLFPTPVDLARRMVQEAGVFPGERVLEPSAGTGNIIRAILGAFTGADCGRIVAVELNKHLAAGLREQRDRTLYARENNFQVVEADFIAITGPDACVFPNGGDPVPFGKFDRIVMNPPFQNGADIKHIEHAMKFLKPKGRLVAICADGPRQNDRLKPIARLWESLPAGTFKDEGTNVNTALLVYDAPEGE